MNLTRKEELLKKLQSNGTIATSSTKTCTIVISGTHLKFLSVSIVTNDILIEDIFTMDLPIKGVEEIVASNIVGTIAFRANENIGVLSNGVLIWHIQGSLCVSRLAGLSQDYIAISWSNEKRGKIEVRNVNCGSLVAKYSENSADDFSLVNNTCFFRIKNEIYSLVRKGDNTPLFQISRLNAIPFNTGIIISDLNYEQDSKSTINIFDCHESRLSIDSVEKSSTNILDKENILTNNDNYSNNIDIQKQIDSEIDADQFTMSKINFDVLEAIKQFSIDYHDVEWGNNTTIDLPEISFLPGEPLGKLVIHGSIKAAFWRPIQVDEGCFNMDADSRRFTGKISSKGAILRPLLVSSDPAGACVFLPNCRRLVEIAFFLNKKGSHETIALTVNLYLPLLPTFIVKEQYQKYNGFPVTNTRIYSPQSDTEIFSPDRGIFADDSIVSNGIRKSTFLLNGEYYNNTDSYFVSDSDISLNRSDEQSLFSALKDITESDNNQDSCFDNLVHKNNEKLEDKVINSFEISSNRNNMVHSSENIVYNQRNNFNSFPESVENYKTDFNHELYTPNKESNENLCKGNDMSKKSKFNSLFGLIKSIFNKSTKAHHQLDISNTYKSPNKFKKIFDSDIYNNCDHSLQPIQINNIQSSENSSLVDNSYDNSFIIESSLGKIYSLDLTTNIKLTPKRFEDDKPIEYSNESLNRRMALCNTDSRCLNSNLFYENSLNNSLNSSKVNIEDTESIINQILSHKKDHGHQILDVNNWKDNELNISLPNLTSESLSSSSIEKLDLILNLKYIDTEGCKNILKNCTDFFDKNNIFIKKDSSSIKSLFSCKRRLLKEKCIKQSEDFVNQVDKDKFSSTRQGNLSFMSKRTGPSVNRNKFNVAHEKYIYSNMNHRPNSTKYPNLVFASSTTDILNNSEIYADLTICCNEPEVLGCHLLRHLFHISDISEAIITFQDSRNTIIVHRLMAYEKITIRFISSCPIVLSKLLAGATEYISDIAENFRVISADVEPGADVFKSLSVQIETAVQAKQQLMEQQANIIDLCGCSEEHYLRLLESADSGEPEGIQEHSREILTGCQQLQMSANIVMSNNVRYRNAVASVICDTPSYLVGYPRHRDYITKVIKLLEEVS